VENIRGNIGDAFIRVSVVETADSMGRFITNLMAGKLNIEIPSNPHFICSEVLHHINHSTVARFVNDGLEVLWPPGVYEKKVLFLYSDAAGTFAESCNCIESVLP
jgi:hypothetical protein